MSLTEGFYCERRKIKERRRKKVQVMTATNLTNEGDGSMAKGKLCPHLQIVDAFIKS